MYLNLLAVFLLVHSCVALNHSNSKDYVAAVYEHAAFFIPGIKTPPRELALKIMMINLAVYEEQAKKAKSRGAQIIVFPEDGLYGYGYKRDDIKSFLEIIPKASSLKHPWNPCLDPSRFSNTEVLNKLSCIAMNNTIAVVANMGDLQPCSKPRDPNCPDDNHYQYNTDVVFDLDGTFLAKYHKQHLFHENQFNTPSQCEYVTFTTGFGVRFGVFTCFDMLFKCPAVDLVEKYGIRNIVFPTAWFDGFPILMSVEYQQSWSRTNCVNLLAANIHIPLDTVDFFGSGIYSCGEIKAYVFDPLATKEQRLLIATLPDLEATTKDASDPPNPGALMPQAEVKQALENVNKEASDDGGRMAPVFEGEIMDDNYMMKWLDPHNTRISVCHNALCCTLDYSIGNNKVEESYALGAFRGHHNPEGFFLEVCILLKCAGSSEKMCGTKVDTSSTVFKYVQLSGNFTSTAHVYPEILTSGLKLAAKQEVSVSGHVTMTTKTLREPLISASLFGRDYDKDKP
ncbi:pantetheinase-like [Actinia tenebrosa]|uniref:Pantetheinase-like n=1 Tax=Actinia tenebrosa TaxID=6105 RepID=A0A6P8IFZ5_ACTTE|nr:pantetheinase-like [Actinia tenebrosa]